jgi:hypothetical protein
MRRLKQRSYKRRTPVSNVGRCSHGTPGQGSGQTLLSWDVNLARALVPREEESLRCDRRFGQRKRHLYSGQKSFQPGAIFSSVAPKSTRPSSFEGKTRIDPFWMGEVVLRSRDRSPLRKGEAHEKKIPASPKNFRGGPGSPADVRRESGHPAGFGPGGHRSTTDGTRCRPTIEMLARRTGTLSER